MSNAFALQVGMTIISS